MWRPVVEILILTVIIYHVFRFIRAPGAPVVTGFLFVLLAFVMVAFLLELKVLQYLLGGFSAFFARGAGVVPTRAEKDFGGTW
jgi:diadenylate cyclase